MGTWLVWVYYSLNSPPFPRRVPVPVLDPTSSPTISYPTTQHFRNQKLYKEKKPWTGLEKEIPSTAIVLYYTCARMRLDEPWSALFVVELLISPKPAKTGCFALA